MPDAVDVCIAGAGPAGSALAIALARRGRSVLLCDAGDGRARKVGEALVPASRPLLRALGVDAASLDVAHRRSFGVVSAWSEGAPVERDFLCDPQGHGWHLDRPRFEHDLRARAERAGATVRLRVRLEAPSAAGAGWDLTLRGLGGDRRVRARFLADASGRGAWATRAFRERPERDSSQVAVHTTAAPRAGCSDARVLVERTERGWWYAALLPSGRVSVSLQVSAGQARGLRTTEAFTAALRETRLIAALADPTAIDGPLQVVAAHGVARWPVAGPAWVAVGDAAAAFDPLSSQGLFGALHAGVAVAPLIEAALAGCPGELSGWEERVRSVWDRYTVHRRALFAATSAGGRRRGSATSADLAL